MLHTITINQYAWDLYCPQLGVADMVIFEAIKYIICTGGCDKMEERVAELVPVLKMTPQTIKSHISNLEDCGLLRRGRNGDMIAEIDCTDKISLETKPKVERKKKEELVIPIAIRTEEFEVLWNDLVRTSEWSAKSIHARQLRLNNLRNIAEEAHRADNRFSAKEFAIASLKQTRAKGWLDFYPVKPEYYPKAKPTNNQINRDNLF